jgi:hypothetical protein
VIGPDGQPTTSITTNRAIVAGPVQPIDPLTGHPKVDAQGNPVLIPGYQNHDSCACRKSNSHIQMMKSAENWRRKNATNGMYCSRRRRVLVD